MACRKRCYPFDFPSLDYTRHIPERRIFPHPPVTAFATVHLPTFNVDKIMPMTKGGVFGRITSITSGQPELRPTDYVLKQLSKEGGLLDKSGVNNGGTG